MQSNIDLRDNKAVLPDAIRVFCRVIGYYIPKKGSIPLYTFYEPLIKDVKITLEYYNKIMENSWDFNKIMRILSLAMVK